MKWEEIQKAIENDPQLATQILENVPNITGGSKYLENANKAYFDQNIGSYTSEIYNKLDQDIFDVTGLRKEASEKSYDFQKRVLADLKSKAEKSGNNTPEEVKEYQNKIKDLEEKLKNGESSSHWKKSYEEIVEELRNKTQEFQTQIKERDEKLLNNNVNSDISNAISKLKFNESLPESVRNAMLNQVKNKLTSNAKIIDGKVVYHDQEGKPILDKQYQSANAEYLLKDELKDILASDKKPGGGASQEGKSGVVINGTGDSATKKLVLDKSKFNTRQEFLTEAEKALSEQGIARSDKEYNSLIDQAHKEYGVSELKRN